MMTPGQFTAWRKALGLKQKDAADLLGLKKRVIQYYEKGKRDGKSESGGFGVGHLFLLLLVG